jgi:hypothetical protein
MNPKMIIRIVLLGVIAIAVGAWAMKEFGPRQVAATGGDSKATVPTTRPDGVTVINFHGEKRCRTCIGIGNQARKTLDEEFAAEEKAGKVHWEHINYDEPANAHYVKDYQLVSSTVLVTLWKDGREVKWNRLDGVWDHVGDEPKFRAYLAQGVRDLLNPP